MPISEEGLVHVRTGYPHVFQPFCGQRFEFLSFSVALVVVPAIYIAASLVAQAACIGLGMALAWRMEMDPLALVWFRVDLLKLLIGQLGGYLLMTLWLEKLECRQRILLCRVPQRPLPGNSPWGATRPLSKLAWPR